MGLEVEMEQRKASAAWMWGHHISRVVLLALCVVGARSTGCEAPKDPAPIVEPAEPDIFPPPDDPPPPTPKPQGAR
jgi:hypothetical protein